MKTELVIPHQPLVPDQYAPHESILRMVRLTSFFIHNARQSQTSPTTTFQQRKLIADILLHEKEMNETMLLDRASRGQSPWSFKEMCTVVGMGMIQIAHLGVFELSQLSGDKLRLLRAFVVKECKQPLVDHDFFDGLLSLSEKEAMYQSDLTKVQKDLQMLLIWVWLYNQELSRTFNKPNRNSIVHAAAYLLGSMYKCPEYVSLITDDHPKGPFDPQDAFDYRQMSRMIHSVYSGAASKAIGQHCLCDIEREHTECLRKYKDYVRQNKLYFKAVFDENPPNSIIFPTNPIAVGNYLYDKQKWVSLYAATGKIASSFHWITPEMIADLYACVGWIGFRLYDGYSSL